MHDMICRSLTAALILLFTAGHACSQAAGFSESFVNLPANTEAFETRFDLDGDGRSDVLVVFQRRILIFFQKSDNTFPVAPDVEIGAGEPIPEMYAALTVGKIKDGPGCQLLLVGPKGVDFLNASVLRSKDQQAIEPQILVRRPVQISPQPNLKYLDAAPDLDGDGRAEIVVPDSGQLQVLKSTDGQFAPRSSVSLPMRTMQWTTLLSEPPLLGSHSLLNDPGTGLVRLLPTLDRWHGVQFSIEEMSGGFLLADYNLDKKMDVILPSRVLYQNPAGKFEATESDIYSRLSRAYLLHPLQASEYSVPSQRVVVAPNLFDLNGDSILDTFRVDVSAAKFSPRTDVAVFLGKPDRSFGENPDFVLRTRDFAYTDQIPLGDLDQDGCQDIGLLHFDFQPSSANSQLKAYIRSGLDGELRFYLWDKKTNRYPDGYTFKHRLMVNYEIYGYRQAFRQQVVINQDMDGDRRPDLVLKTGPQEISVFRNQGGSRGFESKPAMRVSTPTRFSSFVVQDMNGDGKGDILTSGYVENQEDRIIYAFFESK